MEERIVPEMDLRFADKESLHRAFMPFIQGGALFVPSKESFELGSQVILKVNLPEELDPHVLVGEVAWITPLGAQGGKKAGIGVQLQGDTADALRKKIETLTAGITVDQEQTDTM